MIHHPLSGYLSLPQDASGMWPPYEETSRELLGEAQSADPWATAVHRYRRPRPDDEDPIPAPTGRLSYASVGDHKDPGWRRTPRTPQLTRSVPSKFFRID